MRATRPERTPRRAGPHPNSHNRHASVAIRRCRLPPDQPALALAGAGVSRDVSVTPA